jgi:hypothetical protein
MTNEEEKEIKQAITKDRNYLQAHMADTRRLRMELRLQGRVRYTDFLQKIGELSLVFGAAIVPLILVTNANENIKYPLFVFTGAALYLVNGILALWATKEKIEQDGNDSPHVGLDEEIHTYPIINAKNKLLLELDNQDHLTEHQKAENDLLSWAQTIETRKSPLIFWVEILLLNFVTATTLVAGTVWPYSLKSYWIAFGAIIIFLVALVIIGYKRALKTQSELEAKHKKLAKIKGDYSKWREEKLQPRDSQSNN